MNPERCRACLKETDPLKKSISMISKYSEKHNQTFFEILTNIEMNGENENFPKLICASCEEFINSVYEFQEMCIKSRKKLELEAQLEENDESLRESPSEFIRKPETISEKKDLQKKQSKFLCAVCGASFKAKHTLQSHMNIHNDLRPHKCEICSKSFRHKSNLTDHKSFVHSGKTISCSFCDKKFQTNAVLKIHLKTHNEGDRRFKCDLCSKSYFENHLLQVHKLVHTKIRHYCNICGKDYVRLMSLTRHMHSHSDVKPFACNICNYSSIEKHSVKKHMMKKHNLYDEQIKNG